MNTHSRSDRIVVGVDGSEYSSNTLQMAGRMAAALGGPLEVITCIGMSDYYLTSRWTAPYSTTPRWMQLSRVQSCRHLLWRAGPQSSSSLT